MALASLLLLAAGPVYLSDEPRPPAITVDVKSTLVTGPDGKPLYTYDGVERGDYCINTPCREQWPMLRANKSDKAAGSWSPVFSDQIAGGAGIWFYKGKPVYTYAPDSGGRKAKGDGIAGDWHALQYIGPAPRVALPPSVRVLKVDKTFILTDHRGNTLYTFARDAKAAACKGECLEVWPPLLAPMMALPVGDWTVVERADDVRQWAYHGKLVYTFSEDTEPSQTNGADEAGLWKTITVTNKDAAKSATIENARKRTGG